MVQNMLTTKFNPIRSVFIMACCYSSIRVQTRVTWKPRSTSIYEFDCTIQPLQMERTAPMDNHVGHGRGTDLIN
jgi:hypothetical protein